MRSIAFLLALTTAGSWAVVEALPEGSVHAETRLAQTQEIHSISIDGGRGLPVTQLRGMMTSQVGGIVDTHALATDRAALQADLAARGYLAAEVSMPIVTYGPSGGAYIVFDIERGPLYHIRTITLDGPHWNDVVVTIAAGDEAVGTRIQRVRQSAQDTLARLGKRAQVDIAVTVDKREPVVDVRLVTR